MLPSSFWFCSCLCLLSLNLLSFLRDPYDHSFRLVARSAPIHSTGYFYAIKMPGYNIQIRVGKSKSLLSVSLRSTSGRTKHELKRTEKRRTVQNRGALSHPDGCVNASRREANGNEDSNPTFICSGIFLLKLHIRREWRSVLRRADYCACRRSCLSYSPVHTPKLDKDLNLFSRASLLAQKCSGSASFYVQSEASYSDRFNYESSCIAMRW